MKQGALLALQYLPFVLQGVVQVETALAGAPGTTKKAAVLSAIDASAQVGMQVPDEHVKTISDLIDSVVAALNKTGWFTSKPKTQ